MITEVEELKRQLKWSSHRVCVLLFLFFLPLLSLFYPYLSLLFSFFLQARSLQETLVNLDVLFKGYQDAQVKGLTDKLVQLESRLVEAVVNGHEAFYPRFLTAVASRRWLLGNGMRLFLAK